MNTTGIAYTIRRVVIAVYINLLYIY